LVLGRARSEIIVQKEGEKECLKPRKLIIIMNLQLKGVEIQEKEVRQVNKIIVIFVYLTNITSLNFIGTTALLCKKIKNEFKKMGSNKLSKYLKTCKENTKVRSKKE